MSGKFLFDGPGDAPVTILLAHGAGAPMDSTSMTAAAMALAGVGFRVARFEFGYMAARRTADGRKPPPRAETLNPEYRAAIAELGAQGTLVIGGKSMGGRVASMVADDLHAEGKIAGLLCLGYPFHPPRKTGPVAHPTSYRSQDACSDLSGDPRRIRHPRRGFAIRLVRQDRTSLAGGRRPRPQAAQDSLGLLDRRSPEDAGRGGCAMGGSPRALSSS